MSLSETRRTPGATLARPRLTHLLTRESAEAERRCPRSKEAYARAGHLFGRVPMT
ncbi:hypothetical protein [Streptomyces sp. RG80]|uniref:hypothetical protein n=1 Tax=Streptomyces sp. RG80 TaxID=3157340 RepID=UPI00338E8722